MAREVDEKGIELKVSVNCCDGCKRKVQKALRNVQGVMKTEIDPWQPKLRVIGNVDPRILIKKLSKVGKHAQLLGTEYKGMGQEENEKTKPEPEPEQPKHSGSSYTKTIEKIEYAEQGKRRASKEEHKDTNISISLKEKDEEKKVTETYKEVIKKEVPPPQPPRDQVNFNMYPSMVHASQYGYKVVEPPMPCYALPSYSYPPNPMAATSYGHMDHDYYSYSAPPVYQDPVMQAGDYFSDENTTGCNIM